jgi:hypothetical protein
MTLYVCTYDCMSVSNRLVCLFVFIRMVAFKWHKAGDNIMSAL